MAKRRDHTVQVITITQPTPYITRVVKGSFGKHTPEWHWLQPGQVLVIETSAGGQRWHEYLTRQEAAAHFDLEDDDEASVIYDTRVTVGPHPLLRRARLAPRTTTLPLCVDDLLPLHLPDHC